MKNSGIFEYAVFEDDNSFDNIVIPKFVIPLSDIAKVTITKETVDGNYTYFFDWKPKEALYVCVSAPYLMDNSDFIHYIDTRFLIGPYICELITYDPMLASFILKRVGDLSPSISDKSNVIQEMIGGENNIQVDGSGGKKSSQVMVGGSDNKQVIK